ncbi:MAG: DNA alkylation repair protein [Alphaproteobacteria bacterium]|jgi:3-methyladenine DNA glycosylase AlkD|nr:DNA alkylation repair protein [Alphaproteobacteria bacterium]MBT4016514.1 DNA alkylation repair protein [Alphaproteobacteria bacterium]MBT5160067.1 DNA alkylation repair protein [Alphaproteobacteria bacterium]MBT5918726.1 DNA alkylation repair protein [Alphaproteobacteria bacterium]MBT6384365.1 DNA alkylation repair protein [Alphaproteobacteria bacterium]
MTPGCKNLINKMKAMADPEALAGKARFGINIENSLGLRMPQIRNLAREIGRDHNLALELWQTGIVDARILAPLIAQKKEVTDQLMESWVTDFASWDVCDQCCINLFRHHATAFDKVTTWAAREEEFVRRAGFALLATLAVHKKQEPDQTFIDFFPLIEHYAFDNRNFVKKAVNWALRQIGKRNKALNLAAIGVSNRILEQDTPPTRWIANDALRELHDKKILARFKN